MKFKVKKYGRKNAYATCPKHKDTHPSLAIDIVGQYAGCFHCFSCGYSGKISQEELQQLKERHKMEKYENPTPINWGDIANMYGNYGPPVFLTYKWDICMDILYDLCIGDDGEAATIPMCNEDGEVVGIQRQFPDGKKCCIEGSQLGLFVPYWYPKDFDHMFITEGCSDCASIMDLGFFAIGRASAGTCIDMTVKWVKKNCPNVQIIIVADNDKPGITAAKELHEAFYENEIPKHEFKIVSFESKDIREEIKVKGKDSVRKILESL